MKQKLPNCKIVLPRPIWKAVNKVAAKSFDDVISQLKELQIDMIANEGITRKNLEKKGFHLNQHGLKKFSEILIAGVRELWKKNSFSIHNVQRSFNQKKSNYQNPLLTATEGNKKTFDCNIVNNYFNDDFDDESAPSKDAINTGIRHIDHR